METTKINLNEEPKGKKETERLDVNTEADRYTEPIVENTDESAETSQDETKKKSLGDVAKMAAAGAIGGLVGGGTAVAANLPHGTEETKEDPPAQATTPTPAPKPTPEQKPETEQVQEQAQESAPEQIQETATEVTPTPAPAPAPDDSPHIEEVLVDADDIDGERIMNIEGTGMVEIEGVEFNAAVVTDEAGNTYYMVDVDGEVNDPNATYDIIVDAETGEMAGLPTNLSVSDAQLMADNGIAYTEPIADDSNNIAQADMQQDVYDPSQPVPEEGFVAEEQYDPLADNSLDTDIIDALS